MPKGNQFSAGPPRPPFKRQDEVTANLIMWCIFYTALGGAAMITLISWVSS